MQFKTFSGDRVDLRYVGDEYKKPHKRARLFQIVKTGADTNGNFDSFVMEFTAKAELVRLVHMQTSIPSPRHGLHELPGYEIKSRKAFKDKFSRLASNMIANGKAGEIIQADC